MTAEPAQREPSREAMDADSELSRQCPHITYTNCYDGNREWHPFAWQCSKCRALALDDFAAKAVKANHCCEDWTYRGAACPCSEQAK